MLQKVTKKDRIALMKNGFYKVGYMSAKEFNERVIHDEYLDQYIDRILFILEDMVEAGLDPINVVKVRSNDIYCSDECYYSYKGKSYLIDGILFHVYEDTDTVSVIKVLTKRS